VESSRLFQIFRGSLRIRSGCRSEEVRTRGGLAALRCGVTHFFLIRDAAYGTKPRRLREPPRIPAFAHSPRSERLKHYAAPEGEARPLAPAATTTHEENLAMENLAGENHALTGDAMHAYKRRCTSF